MRSLFLAINGRVFVFLPWCEDQNMWRILLLFFIIFITIAFAVIIIINYHHYLRPNKILNWKETVRISNKMVCIILAIDQLI